VGRIRLPGSSTLIIFINASPQPYSLPAGEGGQKSEAIGISPKIMTFPLKRVRIECLKRMGQGEK